MNHALLKGVAAARARQFDRARPLLEQATNESPENPAAWFWLAIASPSAEAAIPCLRRVLAIDAAHPQARQVLGKLLVTQAKAVAAAGNHLEARALALEASQLCPDTQPVWLALVSVTEDPAERINVLRQAAQAAPEDVLLRTRLRQALLARGVMIAAIDRAEARARFREAAELDPADLRVWQALANLADTPAERLQGLRELLRVAPGHPRGRLELENALVADARSLAAAGSIEDACERWREAIAFTGGTVEMWLSLAAITRDEEEVERAIAAAYEMAPLDERAIEAMGRLRDSRIDPAVIEAPPDAFDRFVAADDNDGPPAPADPPLEEIDSILDAIADLNLPTMVAEAAQVKGLPPAAAAAAPAPAGPPAPVRAAAAANAAPEATAPPPGAPVNGKVNGASRHTVMVVDDSPTIRNILGVSLEHAGYTVFAEKDGESAIERLAHVVPGLILLDIAMPNLDGYEVCKRIKQDPRTANVPIVMLSGKGAFFDKVKGHMAGATEYLTKPFETPVVLSVVSRFCQPSAEVTHG